MHDNNVRIWFHISGGKFLRKCASANNIKSCNMILNIQNVVQVVIQRDEVQYTKTVEKDASIRLGRLVR